MKTLIVVVIVLLVLLLAIRRAVKDRNSGETKSSAFGHPSSFKKPDIEMVNNPPKKNEETSADFNIEPKEFDKNTE